jgi:hypothetical protein
MASFFKEIYTFFSLRKSRLLKANQENRIIIFFILIRKGQGKQLSPVHEYDSKKPTIKCAKSQVIHF